MQQKPSPTQTHTDKSPHPQKLNLTKTNIT